MRSMPSGPKSLSPLTGLLLTCVAVAGAMLSPGLVAGENGFVAAKTSFAHEGGHYRFGNQAVMASWEVTGNRLAGLAIHDGINQRDIPVPVPFELVTDGASFGIGDMQLLAPPQLVQEQAEPGASRLAARLPGSSVRARLVDAGGRFQVDWRLVQRAGAQYLREIVTVTALKRDEAIRQVALLGVDADGSNVDGTVDGSPVAWHSDWFGFEYPMSHAEVRGGRVRMWVDRELPLRQGKSVTYSAVIGAAPAGQLRRDFAAYVERERAHPYRPFLHYNTYYDLENYTAAQVLGRIAAFGRELVEKRHVELDSFLLDGGWDDGGPDWNFNQGFPQGLAPLCQAARQYGVVPGIWMSPWGGYGKSKLARIAKARQEGYEIVDGGLALSGPKYWQRFHQVAMGLLASGCVNQFKFDGTGNVNSVVPGSQFDSDFAAMIRLIDDIRAAKPDIFINLSTGTWASPFWLRWTDTVWRGSVFDHNFAGVGTPRERWITFRDQMTYQNIVVPGPLFPINSLMLHGIIYAQHAASGARLPDFPGLRADPGHDFANEVHSFFASGTQLQELYITPSLLSADDWDALAAAARWSRDNAKVLRDVHWIGGDPGRLEVYGWAAWTPAKAIVSLRNPDARPQTAVIDLQRQLELPVGAAQAFAVRDVWRSGGAGVPGGLDARHVSTIQLAPFEVLTLELTPQARAGSQ